MKHIADNHNDLKISIILFRRMFLSSNDIHDLNDTIFIQYSAVFICKILQAYLCPEQSSYPSYYKVIVCADILCNIS